MRHRLDASGPGDQIMNKGARVVDAASIIILDRTSEPFRVLVGKRSAKHKFMPGVYVFPGGRRDRRDSALPVIGDLHPSVEDKLLTKVRVTTGPARARGIAVAAVREAYEETGLVIGDQSGTQGSLRPDLSKLRFVARAITPPGRIRRFDTRFFAMFADEADLDISQIRASDELEKLDWREVTRESQLDIPEITQIVLSDLRGQLRDNKALPFGRPVPFYYARYGRFVREEL